MADAAHAEPPLPSPPLPQLRRAARRLLADSARPLQHRAGSLAALAQEALGADEPALAETLAGLAAEAVPGLREALLIQAAAALDLARPAVAQHFRSRAGLGDGPPLRPIVPFLDTPRRGRFLLILPRGTGFWSEGLNLLGGLLLAAITARVPVVHWGRRCLYTPFETPEADSFRRWFPPVSPYSLADIDGSVVGRWPRYWRARRLDAPSPPGGEPATSPLALLNRWDAVAVVDGWTAPALLCDWLPAAHPLAGKPPETVLATLFRQVFRPPAAILQAVRQAIEPLSAEGPVLAVHVRGGDKALELPTLDAINGAAPEAAGAMAQRLGCTKILLLTDSLDEIRRWHGRFPGRVGTLPVRRGEGRLSPHISGYPDREGLARDVLLDTFAALACDGFLGNGSSNLSQAVRLGKDWPEGTLRLLGPDWLTRNWRELHL